MSIYLGTSPIANTGYDKANTDLSNLTSTGKNIANWSNNVTNCITEIPQDIKLELNNGTLTLKAGSKVYVPNGFESDGVTPKFDIINITSDISTNYAGYPDYDNVFICLKTDGSFATYFKAGNQNSGSSGVAYSFTYRTDLNKIYDYEESTTNPYEQISFPIGRFKYQNNGIAVVYQVFNGFGYIGSTVFALPGVKGLIPNGRNADGSLKNIEFTIDTVKTATRTWTDSNGQVWGYVKNPPSGVTETWYWNGYIESDEEPSYNEYVMWYKPSENITYVNNELQSSTPNWEKVNYINFGKASGINQQEIKIFTPRTAFHAVDYNDSSTISGWSMPSSRYIDLTLGASGSTYTAPANGYLFLSKDAGSDWYYCNLVNTSMNLGCFQSEYRTSPNTCCMPAKKGDVIRVDYNATGTTRYFRFIYAEGEQ